LGNGFAFTSTLVWAAGFPAAEVLLATWDPLALITARFLLAVLMLFPIWLWVVGPRRVMAARWGRGTFLGGLGFGGGAWLLLVAQNLTDPVTVTIIAAGIPVMSTLIEMLFEGRRLTFAFVLGLIATVAGGVVAAGDVPTEGLGLGALAAIASCFLFSWGSWATVRELPDLTPLGRTTVTLAGGLIFTGAAFIASTALGFSVVPDVTFDNTTVTALGLYAFGALGLSQVLWIMAVSRIGVALASFHINLAPFLVMLLMLGLGSAWSWPQAIGAAIVAVGVVLSQARFRLPARPRG
jgi:drug/metabolite transporter (DMT)-like permease